MLFKLIEIPEIVWKPTKFLEAFKLNHGWSNTGWVKNEPRFRIFFSNSENEVKLEDLKTNKICTIESGTLSSAENLAKCWLKENFL